MGAPAMKRDMDLVREILLAMEAAEDDPRGIELELPNRSSEEVSLHVELLCEAGLLAAEEHRDWVPTRLTWHGHEVLDTIRDQSIWEQTKEGAEKAGGFTLEFLVALAKEFVKKKIEEHTGVELEL